jgi:hypothetical protein
MPFSASHAVAHIRFTPPPPTRAVYSALHPPSKHPATPNRFSSLSSIENIVGVQFQKFSGEFALQCITCPKGDFMFSKAACRLQLFTLSVTGLFLTAQTVSPKTKDSPLQANSPAPSAKVSAGLELLTDPEGVDFNSSLRQVYLSVKKSWYSIMPPSVEKGSQGRNAIQFRILRDGNIAKDSVELMYHSGKSDLDAASLQAIREAGPFDELPEKFSRPFVVLRVNFYYNLKPPTP